MFEPHQRHCVESLSKNINPSLVLVQPRKTHPFITERLLIGRKESNQTNKLIDEVISCTFAVAGIEYINDEVICCTFGVTGIEYMM